MQAGRQTNALPSDPAGSDTPPHSRAILPALQLEAGPGVVAGAPAANRATGHPQQAGQLLTAQPGPQLGRFSQAQGHRQRIVRRGWW